MFDFFVFYELTV